MFNKKAVCSTMKCSFRIVFSHNNTTTHQLSCKWCLCGVCGFSVVWSWVLMAFGYLPETWATHYDPSTLAYCYQTHTVYISRMLCSKILIEIISPQPISVHNWTTVQHLLFDNKCPKKLFLMICRLQQYIYTDIAQIIYPWLTFIAWLFHLCKMLTAYYISIVPNGCHNHGYSASG